MAKLKEIIPLIEEIAPLSLAESWDNSGLQIGDPDQDIKKIAFALDPDYQTILQCAENKTDLLITHHPLFFSDIKSINNQNPRGKIIYQAIKSDIAVYSAHTSLDSASGGLNDYFFEKLGFNSTQAIISSGEDSLEGLGRIADNKDLLSLGEIADRVKDKLGLKHLRVDGDLNLKSEKIGVCTGSGASLALKACKMGAKVFITGDVKYHDAQSAEENGMGVIDAGHHGSEIIVCELFKKRLDNLLESSGIVAETEIYRSKDVFLTL